MTNKLRETIKGKLITLKSMGFKEVYFRRADNNAMYPHVIFDLESASNTSGDLARRDWSLVIDLYDQNGAYSSIEDAGDEVERLFHCENVPDDINLPTFFFEGRSGIYDDDKRVNHEQIRFSVQNYER